VNFVLGNVGLFRQNSWQLLTEPHGSAEPRLKNTPLHHRYPTGGCYNSVRKKCVLSLCW